MLNINMLNKILIICLIILMIVFGILWFKKTDLKTIYEPYKILKKFQEIYGNWYIKNIELRKMPLSVYVKTVFKYASLNTIKNEFLDFSKNKDDIYHPYFIINLYKDKKDFDNIPYNTLTTNDKIPIYERPPIDDYISVMFEKMAVPVLQIIDDNELHYQRAEANHPDFSKIQPALKEFILFKPKKDMTLKQFIGKSQKATGHNFIDYHASEFSCNHFSHCIVEKTKHLFTLSYNKTISKREIYNDEKENNPYAYEIVDKFQNEDQMIHEFTDQENKVFKSEKLLKKYPFTVAIVNFLIKLLRFKKMLKYLK